MTLIERDHPQWIVEPNVSPQGAMLVNLQKGSQFRFSSENLVLSWDQSRDDHELTEEDLEDFFQQSATLTELVLGELGIKEEQYARIGFRAWYLFAAETHEEAQAWLASLRCWPVADRIQKAFDADLYSASMSIELAGKDRRYRLTFSAAERQSQLEAGLRVLTFSPRRLPKGQREAFQLEAEAQSAKKRRRQTSPYIAIIDIDAYQEEPLLLDVDDFLRSSWASGYDNVRRAVE